MTRKRTTVSRLVSSQPADDLKLINGIGPAFEKSLRDAGIRSFAQLAKLSPGDIATHIPKPAANQIRRQGWIRQARRLASRKTGSDSPKKEPVVTLSHQHYENFTLEFLLNEKNKIRRIRVVHVQSGDVDSWTHWSPDEITNFLARHTKAHLSRAKESIQKTPEAKSESAVISTAHDETTKNEGEQGGYLAPIKFTPASKTPLEASSQGPKSLSVSKGQMDKVRLVNWIISIPDSNSPIRALSRDHSFDVRLTLDISNTALSEKTKLDVTGILFAKKLGSDIRQMIGEIQEVVPYSPIMNLNINNAALTQGLYRLEARIKLNQIGVASLQTIVDASIQGGLIQIY